MKTADVVLCIACSYFGNINCKLVSGLGAETFEKSH